MRSGPPRHRAPAPGWRRALGGLADELFPRRCTACDSDDIGPSTGPFCNTCHNDILQAGNTPVCTRCARTVHPWTLRDGTCGGCRREHFWNVREVVRLGEYAGALRNALLAIKYGGDHAAAEMLGRRLGGAIADRPWAWEPLVVTPMPMHWLRRLQRPADHAALLALAAVAELRDRGVRTELWRGIARRRNTPSQVAMTLNGRKANVRDCFAWSRWLLGRRSQAPRRVCIVDNVLVSGATLHEVSRVLRAGGVKEIYAAVVARGRLPGDRAAISDAAPLDTDACVLQ